jgi:hypothetical protein
VNASTNNTLARNRIHDNQDAGVFFTSGANDCISYNNVSWNNGDHGFDHLSARGRSIANDVAFGNRNDGFSIEGNASGTQLHNCIAVDNGLTTGRYDLWVDGTSASGFVSDYNIIWNSTAAAPIRYIATNHTTLATYQSASLQDAHSLQANPNFVNAAGGDFSLLGEFPRHRRGGLGRAGLAVHGCHGHARVDVPAVANTGAGPVKYSDRGAMEFVADQTPVVTVPATATVAESGLLTVNVTAADPDGKRHHVAHRDRRPSRCHVHPRPGQHERHAELDTRLHASGELQRHVHRQQRALRLRHHRHHRHQHGPCPGDHRGRHRNRGRDRAPHRERDRRRPR